MFPKILLGVKTSFNANEPLIKRNSLRETRVRGEVISHLVAKEVKLQEKPGREGNGGGRGWGGVCVKYMGHVQSIRDKGHFTPTFGTIDLIFYTGGINMQLLQNNHDEMETIQ